MSSLLIPHSSQTLGFVCVYLWLVSPSMISFKSGKGDGKVATGGTGGGVERGDRGERGERG